MIDLKHRTSRAVLFFKNSPRRHEEHEVFFRYVNRNWQIKSKSIRPALVETTLRFSSCSSCLRGENLSKFYTYASHRQVFTLSLARLLQQFL